MSWKIVLHQDFASELERWSGQLRARFMDAAMDLQERGPQLGRPQADHLKGSRHGNMKELRFAADGGCWRIAFAFGPERAAVILAAGDKSGVCEKRFYKELLRKADGRFDEHLDDCRKNRTARCALLKI
jgi:hypothetical protein